MSAGMTHDPSPASPPSARRTPLTSLAEPPSAVGGRVVARRSSLVRALCAVVPAGAFLLALTACGGENDAKAAPEVASLPSSPTTSSAADSTDATPGAGGSGKDTSKGSGGSSGSADDKGRPQMRLDDSEERRDALIHAWDVCLVEHGAHWTTKQAGVAGSKTIADPVPPEASAACKNKLPLGPPELDPSLNPHYRDDMLAQIACMRGHGIKVHLTKDTSVDPHGLGWTYDEGLSMVPANAYSVEKSCQLEAFGGKKGQ